MNLHWVFLIEAKWFKTPYLLTSRYTHTPTRNSTPISMTSLQVPSVSYARQSRGRKHASFILISYPVANDGQSRITAWLERERTCKLGR